MNGGLEIGLLSEFGKGDEGDVVSKGTKGVLVGIAGEDGVFSKLVMELLGRGGECWFGLIGVVWKGKISSWNMTSLEMKISFVLTSKIT